MAQLTVDGDTLVYELSFREKFSTMSWFSKPIMIPLTQVRSVSLKAHAYETLWGGYDPANPLVPDVPGGLPTSGLVPLERLAS